LPCTVDGISGTDHIAELWRQHYATLLNCIKSDLYKVDDIERNVPMTIKSHEVYQAINKLADGKAKGLCVPLQCEKSKVV